ncbi:MAG TPA: hypothetical protein VN253_01815 [Kofleriaceae bacterium]|nr:hypothetical protein [Kofleriaceae bacterium]
MVLLSALLGACTVGEVPSGGGGPDGSTKLDVTAVCSERSASPATAYSHASAPTGPRAGQGCVTAGCHAAAGGGAGANPFAFAGTIYKATDGATPAPGVTVHIFKAADKVSLGKAVTDTAGNFYITGTFDAAPYQVLVSGCGPAKPNDIRPMNTPLNAASDHNCSSGACHGVPGGGAGAAYLGDT